MDSNGVSINNVACGAMYWQYCISKAIKFRELRVFEKFIHEKKEIYMVST